MGTVEQKLLSVCSVVTIWQRCADWFILQQFRVTGTNAGLVAMSNSAMRLSLGLEPASADTENLNDQWIEMFQRSWFSSKFSTQPMKRGSANENTVLAAIISMCFVRYVFEVGMLCLKDVPYLACSPDGVIILDTEVAERLYPFSSIESHNATENMEVLASFEIKPKVTARSLASSISLSSDDPVLSTVGDYLLKKYVAKEHMAQMLQQVIILGLHYSVYVVACETGVLYTVLIYWSPEVIETCLAGLKLICGPVVSWSYEESAKTPQFVDSELRPAISSRHLFWKNIDTHVKVHVPFVPLKLFKHASKSFYCKTKASVDGATEQRAILRCSTSHFKWEQKVVWQTLKTLAINAFIGWRMFQRENLLESSDTLHSLYHYGNLLIKVQSTADFMFDVLLELLNHAANIVLENHHETSVMELGDGVSSTEVERLTSLAINRKRNRIHFLTALMVYSQPSL